MATANLRKQREEMKLGDAIAKMLPPNFDLSSLDQVFSAAAIPPVLNGEAFPNMSTLGGAGGAA